MREQRVSEESKRLALELLINLCARHENQSHLFNIGGVAVLVELQAHKDETIVALSHELLQYVLSHGMACSCFCFCFVLKSS